MSLQANRSAVKYAILFLMFLLAGAFGRAAERLPNILWITCEDMSPRLGCYGDNTVPTPNIDRLASQGVRYTNAFGTYGVCAPNRHTLIMGMYPTSTGAMAMRTWRRTSALRLIKDPKLLAIPTYEATPPPEAKCFTEYLRAAGYYCTNNSKTDYQFQTPVTAWDQSSSKAHWRDRPDSGQPFFAVFNNTITHESKTFKKTSPSVVDPSKVKLPAYYPDTPKVRQALAWHYDNIHVMDKWVGKLLKELEEDGLSDNTIVFFYSDHGDGLPRMKRWVYDSGLRVPLLIRWPDRRDAGRVTDRLVSFVDFAPTVLSLTGIDIPDYMEGQAFLGPQAAAPRKYIFGFRDRMDPAPETIRAVRDKRYKYVRNYRTDLPYIGFIPYRDQAPIMQDIKRLVEAGERWDNSWQFFDQTKPEEELYDCQSDPDEVHNLAGNPKYAEKLAELRSAHEVWKTKHGDLGMIPESELIKRLWPPNGKQPKTAAPQITVSDGLATMRSETEGASIAYRLGKRGRWLLYTKPFPIRDHETISAQAIRLGWKKSDIVSFKP